MAELSRSEPLPDGRPVVPVENAIIEALVERGWTVAVAESLTGGAVSARLCSCPGTEDRMLGGVVGYATEAKRRVLGVTADGVVSAAAGGQMARAVRELFGADVGLGVTGVAGPERQEGQPVGTVFVGWSTPEIDSGAQLACAGAPEQIRREATEQALRLLLAVVPKDGPGAP
jgi:nicotinamide-nucleotide amidase